MIERSGAQILVDQLKLHGVDTAFCVPGESYLHVLDALYHARNHIRLIVNRQEGGAAFAAEAYGKLTGKPGICFVTRGPGAANASVGIQTAHYDSTPMILFVGQVSRAHAGREAFQEIDYPQMFGKMTRWVAQIEDARRIPEFISRAFHLAVSGRPGPVVLALPVDMQADVVTVPDADPYRRARAYPAPDDMDTLRQWLAAAERPLMIVGKGGWTPEATRDIEAFARANNLPTIAAFRSQDLIDNHADQYVGFTGVGMSPELGRRIRDSDLLLVVGSRLDQLSTRDYTLVDIPRPAQRFIHVFPDPDELGRVYQTDLSINATMPEFATAARSLAPVEGSKWAEWAGAGREAYLAYNQSVPAPGAVNISEIINHIRQNTPADTIFTNGAGIYTAWCHRFLSFSLPRTQIAPINGVMGYGVPAAVAAKVIYPGKTVVSIAGDGCFLMNGQELATAVQYELNIVFIVINNSMYGSIRMHQERHFPGNVYGTTLTNPDFAAYARAFGAYGEVVEETAAFPAAFERAITADKPALIELRVDPEALTPDSTLSDIRHRK